MPEEDRLPPESESQKNRPGPFRAAMGKALFVLVLLAMIAATVLLTDYVVGLLGR